MGLITLVEWHQDQEDQSSAHINYDNIVSIRRYRVKRKKAKGQKTTTEVPTDLTKIVLDEDDPVIVAGLPDEVRTMVDEQRFT